MELRDAISRYCEEHGCERCKLRNKWVMAMPSEPKCGDDCLEIGRCSDEAIEVAFDIVSSGGAAPAISDALDALILKMLKSAAMFADTSPDAYLSAIERLMALRK